MTDPLTEAERDAIREALDNWHDDPNGAAKAMFVADLVTRHRDGLLSAAAQAERETLERIARRIIDRTPRLPTNDDDYVVKVSRADIATLRRALAARAEDEA